MVIIFKSFRFKSWFLLHLSIVWTLKVCIFPHEYIYGFCIIFTTNSRHVPTQGQFLCVSNWYEDLNYNLCEWNFSTSSSFAVSRLPIKCHIHMQNHVAYTGCIFYHLSEKCEFIAKKACSGTYSDSGDYKIKGKRNALYSHSLA